MLATIEIMPIEIARVLLSGRKDVDWKYRDRSDMLDRVAACGFSVLRHDSPSRWKCHVVSTKRKDSIRLILVALLIALDPSLYFVLVLIVVLYLPVVK